MLKILANTDRQQKNTIVSSRGKKVEPLPQGQGAVSWGFIPQDLQ